MTPQERKQTPEYKAKAAARAKERQQNDPGYRRRRAEAEKRRRDRWREANPKADAKSKTLSQWTKRGVIFLSKKEQDQWYQRWLNAEVCEKTGDTFSGIGSKRKTLDHCHTTGRPRNIVTSEFNLLLARVEAKGLTII
jgi:hypothetical protein